MLHTKQDRISSCLAGLLSTISYDRILYMIIIDNRFFTMCVNVLTAEIILVIPFGSF